MIFCAKDIPSTERDGLPSERRGWGSFKHGSGKRDENDGEGRRKLGEQKRISATYRIAKSTVSGDRSGFAIPQDELNF